MNAANNAALDTILRAAQQLAGQAKDPTAAEVITAYLAHVEKRADRGDYDRKGLERDRHYLGKFAEQLGGKHVSQCNNQDLADFLAENPQWRKPATKKDALAVVVRAFRWGLAAGLVNVCPYHLPKGLVPPPRPREAIQPREYLAILHVARECNGIVRHNCPSRRAFRVALWALWQTGMRTCEMREACWRHLDWQKGVLRFEAHKTDRASSEDRIVALGRAVRLFRWLYRRRRPKPEDHIFLNGRGRPWTKVTFADLFRKFADLAGVRRSVSPYSVRHAFTVRGLEANLGERQLANLLGHKSSRYIGWYGSSSRTHADSLNRNVDRLHGRKLLSEASAPDVKPSPVPPAPPRPADNAGGQAQRRLADDYYRGLLGRLQQLREEGFSLAAIAELLNAEGTATRMGCSWNASRVRQVLCRQSFALAVPPGFPPAMADAMRQRVQAATDVDTRAPAIAGDMRGKGATLQAIADYLNAAGSRTPYGRLWGTGSVWVLLKQRRVHVEQLPPRRPPIALLPPPAERREEFLKIAMCERSH